MTRAHHKSEGLYILNVSGMWLFLTVPWVGLLYVIVVHPDHTPLTS